MNTSNQSLIQENRYFFAGFMLFLITGFVLLINLKQGELILFFSEHRSPNGDAFFRLTTQLGEEFIYITLIIGSLFYRFRYSLLFTLTGLVVMIVSLVAKTIFAHERPFTFFDKLGQFDQLNVVDGVSLLVGPTSFPSGHTMSAFAMYGLLAFLLPYKKPWGFMFLSIAALVGLSRIYLIQHFVKDVFTGAILGVGIAMLLYQLNQRITFSPNRWYNRSILSWFVKAKA
ncbi:MAG: phosphatase PAP2 family protein [Bacteroidota bacterium]